MHLVYFDLTLFLHAFGHKFVLIGHAMLNKYLIDSPNIASEVRLFLLEKKLGCLFRIHILIINGILFLGLKEFFVQHFYSFSGFLDHL